MPRSVWMVASVLVMPHCSGRKNRRFMFASSTLRHARTSATCFGSYSAGPHVLVIVIQQQPADAAARQHLGRHRADAADALHARRPLSAHSHPAPQLRSPHHNRHGLVADALIVRHDAHALQRHQPRVRVGVLDLLQRWCRASARASTRVAAQSAHCSRGRLLPAERCGADAPLRSSSQCAHGLGRQRRPCRHPPPWLPAVR
jgi:hypothetical protein